MRLILAFALLAGCSRAAAPSPDLAVTTAWSFAVISDLHVGEGYPSYAGQEDAKTANVRAAVARLDAVAASVDLQLVFVTGDLTDSAEPAELDKAREILDGLVVPYVPLLGNHDVWTYTSTSEKAAPTGDAQFAARFADRWAATVHGDGSAVDPACACNRAPAEFHAAVPRRRLFRPRLEYARARVAGIQRHAAARRSARLRRRHAAVAERAIGGVA